MFLRRQWRLLRALKGIVRPKLTFHPLFGGSRENGTSAVPELIGIWLQFRRLQRLVDGLVKILLQLVSFPLKVSHCFISNAVLLRFFLTFVEMFQRFRLWMEFFHALRLPTRFSVQWYKNGLYPNSNEKMYVLRCFVKKMQ